MRHTSKSLLLAAGIAFAATTSARAVVVDFTPLAFSQLSFSSGGVTVTGTSGGLAANVYSQIGSGVGVVGGFNDFTVDRSDGSSVLETITYSFDSGAATGIAFSGMACVGSCTFAIEAFAPGGASLGTVANSGDLVSALFGNVPIASFLISLPTNFRGVGINAIVFDSADVSEVPLPAALPLFASGLGLLGLLGWRRRRNAAA
jgi:hypothetical protein